jgi:enoyl-CoA hydratase/carnithine racemase
MTQVVQRSIEHGVALVTFNRPERLNAWTTEMEGAYFDLLADCGRREDVRAIVVTGAGRGFCAGADMEALQTIEREGRAQSSGRPQTFPLSVPKPIIAAINGACAGVGLVQALMCDLRFASDDAKLTTAFARRGLIAEHGLSWILPRIVGSADALDLLLSGRVVLGQEAAAIGLVNRAVSPESVVDEALAYARDLAANCAPSSMATIKHQVYADLERSAADALQEADRLMAASHSSPDLAEGIESFLARRPPRFAALSN